MRLLVCALLAGCLRVSTSGDPPGNLRFSSECLVERSCRNATHAWTEEACEDVGPMSKRLAQECHDPGGIPACDVPLCRVTCHEIAEPCAE